MFSTFFLFSFKQIYVNWSTFIRVKNINIFTQPNRDNNRLIFATTVFKCISVRKEKLL